ncbi:SprT family protein [Halobacillus yeomjeoni]|uniref:SprT family protein n=1 Tax=Halobacillus yeomjeoni TaxID=311194 RepID=UPI002E1D8F01
MTEDQLQRWTEELSAVYFNKPFIDKIIFNARLRTTGGRYVPSRRIIEINPKYLDEIGMDEVEGIIKHELCHYHLHIEGKGYAHRDPEFKELLKKTGSPRHCKPLPSMKKAEVHRYVCKKCGQQYPRKRRLNTKRYACGKCKGKLEKM